MALPRRRCYSIERLLREVQIVLPLPPSHPLSLSPSPLSLSLSFTLSLSVCFSILVSSYISHSRTFFALCLSPDHRFLLVVLVLVLRHLLPHLFTFPLSLIPFLSLPPYLLPPSLIPFSLPPSSFSRLLVTRRRPPSTISS